MTAHRQPLWYLLTQILLASALLMSCGGGTDVAGIPGTGGTGTRDGLVTGFGSVYIDGQKFDNSQIQPMQQQGSNQNEAVSFALGQRVSIEYDTNTSVIKTAKVMPHLVGPVDSIDLATGWLHVLGQAVRIVTAQTPYPDRPGFMTQLVNSQGAALDINTLAAGDWLELHGHWLQGMSTSGQQSSTLPANTAINGLLASRLQVLGSTRAQALVSGQVSATTDKAQQATITTADGRQLSFDNAGPQIAMGQLASVWVNADQLQQWRGEQVIQAVSGTTQLGQDTQTPDRTILIGPLQSWEPSTRALRINDQNFTVPEALLTTQLRQVLANPLPGQHCQVVLKRSDAQTPWTVLQVDMVKSTPQMVQAQPASSWIPDSAGTTAKYP